MRAILIVLTSIAFCIAFIAFFTIFLEVPLLLLGGFLLIVTVVPKRRPRNPPPAVAEPVEVATDD